MQKLCQGYWKALGQPNGCHTGTLPLAAADLFGEEGVAFGWGEGTFEQFQALADIAAGELPGTRLHVDIATDAVQEERQGVTQGLSLIVGPDCRFTFTISGWAMEVFLF